MDTLSTDNCSPENRVDDLYERKCFRRLIVLRLNAMDIGCGKGY